MTSAEPDFDIHLIDTHMHLIYREKFDYSWTQSISELDASSFSLESYRSSVSKSGVEKSLFMESGVDDDFWQNETRFVLGLMDDPDSKIAGVIASCRPEGSDELFDRWLSETEDQRIVGYRRILHVQPDELSARDNFIKNVRKIGSNNKTFDICVLERQLPCAIALARNADNTQMILDHCGVPDIGSGDLAFWKKQISKLAQLDNVACKVSGLVAYCPPGIDLVEAIKPYLEHCVDCFGWERLVWGSDWPVCNLSEGVNHWIALFRKLLSQEAKETQRKVCYENAVKFYRI